MKEWKGEAGWKGDRDRQGEEREARDWRSCYIILGFSALEVNKPLNIPLSLSSFNSFSSESKKDTLKNKMPKAKKASAFKPSAVPYRASKEQSSAIDTTKHAEDVPVAASEEVAPAPEVDAPKVFSLVKLSIS